MTTPDDHHDGHFGALVVWLDAVNDAFRKLKAIDVTVDGASLPGAMIAEVRPDADGINATITLINWANPEIVLRRPPTEHDVHFELYLEGAQRVVIVCAPPVERTRGSDFYRLEPADKNRIEDRLIEVASALKASDPAWEPQSALVEPATLVDAFFAEHLAPDSRMTVEAAVSSSSVRTALVKLQDERTREHQRVWAADAEQIARTILDGEDGATVRDATAQVHRRHAQRHLQRLDATCADREGAEPVAKAITTLARRPRDVTFEWETIRKAHPGFGRHSPSA